MKKRVLSISLVLALCLALLTGCSGSSSVSESSASQQTATQQTATQQPAEQGADSQPATTESQGWVPTKDIEFIVGNKAGGGADLFTRKVVEIIQKYNMIPTNITVVNKPGSSHVVGYTYLMENGDDYHLDVVSSSFYAQPVSGNSPLTFSDFAYVSMLCKDPSLLVASNASGLKTFADVIAYAKAHPGELIFAGSSAMGDDTILWAQICQQCEVDITYVAMESGADVLTNVLGGHVALGCVGPSEIGDNLAAGNLVAIAIAADERFNEFGLQDTPTFVEEGYQINHQQHRGFVMAKTASAEAVKYYSDVIGKVFETPEWEEFMRDNCMAPFHLNCDEYAEYNQTLVDTYTTFIGIIMAAQG